MQCARQDLKFRNRQLSPIQYLQQCVEPDALWRVDGGVEVVHDEVRVGERQVRRHQREQQPSSVPVLRVHVSL